MTEKSSNRFKFFGFRDRIYMEFKWFVSNLILDFVVAI